MVEPQNIPREQFPKSTSFSEGMITLDITPDNHEMYHIRDIKYISRPEAELTIQLITPGWDVQKPPLIMFVTGSAFFWQDMAGSIPRLSLLANKGFAVASVQYRGSEAAPFPAQMLDAKAAVRFMKMNADKYGIDGNNVFIMGDSSGGHTALLAGFTAGIEEFEEDIYSEQSSDVRGIIDLYGPVDISRMNDELSAFDHMVADSPAGCLIGRKNVLENPELVRPTIVTNYISSEREIPPVLIFHGTNDEQVAFGQSCILYDKLKEHDKTASFYAIDGAHHGGSVFWSERVLGIVSDFVRRFTL
ncbi:MAG: alpha/beta hydrolase [Ruminococcaceae bacterium]|nr:alpha/beta hydrolase [Oscillospiraceae bacterium]